MRMAEKEQEHAHEMARAISRRRDHAENRATRGVNSAWSLGVIGFIVAALMGYWGYPGEGATVATGTLAALATAFISGTATSKRNTQQKAKPENSALPESKAEKE